MKSASILAGLMLLAAPAAAAPVAVVNGTVHTMGAAGIVTNGTVVFDQGRIVAVGAGIAAPAGATVIDAKGAPVTPGLMNSFTRLGLVEIEQIRQTDDSDARDAAFSAAFDVTPGLLPDSLNIQVTRVKGVTRAVTAPDFGKTMFAGLGAVLSLGDGETFTVRPRVAMFAALGETGKRLAGGSRGAAVGFLRQALDDARYYARNRADFDDNRARATVLPRADLEALVPVAEGKLPLVIDVRRASDIRTALALAAEQKLRIILVGAQEAWQVAGEIAAAGVPVIIDPSNNLPNRFESMGATLENAARLHAAGVKLLFMAGSDQMVNNARNVRQMAGIAVANGLPHDAALAALTVNPAAVWGLADRYGTLEPGKDADVVVWDGDPLEVTAAPTHVFVMGRAVSLVTRQTRLRDRYRSLAPAAAPNGYR